MSEPGWQQLWASPAWLAEVYVVVSSRYSAVPRRMFWRRDVWAAPLAGSPLVAWLPFITHLALGVCIGVLAIALRVQHLTDIPRYTDEINEITPAFDIMRGDRFPLTSGPKHIGALFDYVLAAAMLVFGRTPDLPREVILVCGLVTILLTYGYARSLGGRWAALLATGLLTVSAPHVLLSSRVAWSACLTPMLGVGAAWAVDRAVARRQPSLLIVGALLLGLALQAHPSFLALLPGFGLFVLVRGHALLRRPASYVAIVAFLVGCANVLVYNWQSGVGGLRSVTQQYDGAGPGVSAYVENLGAPLRGFALTLASAVDPTRVVSPLEPFVLLSGIVAVVALAWLARTSSLLPLLVVASALLFSPFLHDNFSLLLKARYLMPLVPLTVVAMGILLTRLIVQPPAAGAAFCRAGAAGLAVSLLVIPTMSLWHFEEEVLAVGCTNAPQRAFVAEMERHLRPGEWILLDQGVLSSGERFGYLTILELSSRKVGQVGLGRGKIWDELDERPSFLTAVRDGKALTLFERQGLPLLPQDIRPDHPAYRLPGPDGRVGIQGIGLYRVSPDGAALLAHDPSPGCGSLRAN